MLINKKQTIYITAIFSLSVTLFSCNTGKKLSGGSQEILANSLKTEGWQTLESMPVPRYNLQANMINGNIFVSGGINNDIGVVDNFDLFNPVTKKWSALETLPFPRYIHASAVIDNKLYLIGGYNLNADPKTLISQKNSKAALSNLDCYDSDTKTWKSLSPMTVPRFMPGSAVYKGKIYVAGGAQRGSVLDSVEVYDPAKNQWEIISKMPEPRAWGKFVSFDNALYLVGGSSGNNEYPDSIHRYDPDKNLWFKDALPPLKVPRWGFATAVNDKGFYIVGGSNQNGFVDSVEFYNFNDRQWSTLPPISPARGGADAVSLNNGIFIFGMDPWSTNNTLFLEQQN
jgi:N-acetylneuraminic acid mutarotase